MPNFEWRAHHNGAMTRADALQVFMRNGIAAPESMTPSELRAAHQHLAWSNHPDLGGDIKKMQLINSAYAVLKKQMPGRHLRAGDYTNADCFKKSIRELAGEVGEDWIILGFDGYYFRKAITVFGRRQFFDLMAEAMLIFQTKGAESSPCRAIFVRNVIETNTLYLIYLDGKYYGDRAIRMEHQSSDADPTNDPLFVHSLPRVLDDIRSGHRPKIDPVRAKRNNRAPIRAALFVVAGIALSLAAFVALRMMTILTP